MRARNYDPTTGRFTQRDPVAPQVGTPFVSPYVFALDRPTFFGDPTGDSVVTTLFQSHSTTAANVAQGTKDGYVILSLTIKAAGKLSGYSAAVEESAAKMGGRDRGSPGSGGPG